MENSFAQKKGLDGSVKLAGKITKPNAIKQDAIDSEEDRKKTVDYYLSNAPQKGQRTFSQVNDLYNQVKKLPDEYFAVDREGMEEGPFYDYKATNPSEDDVEGRNKAYIDQDLYDYEQGGRMNFTADGELMNVARELNPSKDSKEKRKQFLGEEKEAVLQTLRDEMDSLEADEAMRLMNLQK